MKALDEFVDKETGLTIKNVVEGWTDSTVDATKKYTYRKEGTECTYSIKGLRGIFRMINCKVLVIQDQTPLENLAKLDEKYQKLYLASIVHDIRTPLNAIIGMLEMMNEKETSDENQNYISVAKRTCKLMLFLTHDITDYSLLESNKFRVSNSKVNIRDTVKEVHQLLAYSFEKKKLAYYFVCSETTPEKVVIDKNRYMQILINVLSNALKYTFEGHIKVSVDYQVPNDLLMTSVQDTGVGIKEEDLPKLFKLFGKLESNIEHNTQGVGFGLAICKKLAESMGGYVTVASKEGVGSTFTFTIKGNMSQFEEEPEGRIISTGSENFDMSSYMGEHQVSTQLQKYIMNPSISKLEFSSRPIAVSFLEATVNQYHCSFSIRLVRTWQTSVQCPPTARPSRQKSTKNLSVTAIKSQQQTTMSTTYTYCKTT
eukprot:TRINITY_DN71219_c0_g1_i1.p1 TRINITY_DN71219_c0_g1~~TRINITY_DN71219_c0_g1_i1.p1  ORF type:complete len:427 (-),score=39.65 TRINITY_DN71219_c0_g1_i1:452-1732(-)